MSDESSSEAMISANTPEGWQNDTLSLPQHVVNLLQKLISMEVLMECFLICVSKRGIEALVLIPCLDGPCEAAA